MTWIYNTQKRTCNFNLNTDIILLGIRRHCRVEGESLSLESEFKSSPYHPHLSQAIHNFSGIF